MTELGISAYLRQRLYLAANLVSVRVRLVSASLADCDSPVRLLLVGDGWFLRDLGSLFSSVPREIWTRRVPLPLLRSVLRARAGEFDLGFAVIPGAHQRPFAPSRAYRGKLSVGQAIDLSGGWGQVRSRFVKSLRNQTNDFERKRGLSCRESRSAQDFEHFYESMYLPYARSRFGQFASVKPKQSLRRIFDAGLLFFIERDGVALACQLCAGRGDVFWFATLGVLDGDLQHVRAGALTACYFYCIRHALRHGYRAMDVGGGLPFLSDGVLRHKADWGAQLCELERESECFDLFLGARPAAAMTFLARHPTVVDDGGRMCVLAALPAHDGDAMEQLGVELQRWRKLGLETARLLTPEGWHTHALRSDNPPD